MKNRNNISNTVTLLMPCAQKDEAFGALVGSMAQVFSRVNLSTCLDTKAWSGLSKGIPIALVDGLDGGDCGLVLREPDLRYSINRVRGNLIDKAKFLMGGAYYATLPVVDGYVAAVVGIPLATIFPGNTVMCLDEEDVMSVLKRCDGVLTKAAKDRLGIQVEKIFNK